MTTTTRKRFRCLTNGTRYAPPPARIEFERRAAVDFESIDGARMYLGSIGGGWILDHDTAEISFVVGWDGAVTGHNNPDTPLVNMMRSENLKFWLESQAAALGDENQRERFAAGLLPEEELLSLARTRLFARFTMPRWHAKERRRAMEDSFHHHPRCFSAEDYARIRAGEHPKSIRTPVFTVRETNSLNAIEWTNHKLIHEAALQTTINEEWLIVSGTKVSLFSMEHELRCNHCDTSVRRCMTKVTIPWAGRQLVREFAL